MHHLVNIAFSIDHIDQIDGLLVSLLTIFSPLPLLYITISFYLYILILNLQIISNGHQSLLTANSALTLFTVAS